MIKKRIVKCEWQSVLEWRDNHGDYNMIEVLAVYDTKEEAVVNRPNFYGRISGTSRILSVRYHEEILSEEVVE